jgi:predicted short-subunit dehydrogenase-like oxidoreductase (DUF2520 family)
MLESPTGASDGRTHDPMPMRPRRQPQPKPGRQTPAKKRPTVTIIGAGRLGTALGIALKEAGYRVDPVVTKRAATAKRAARLIGSPTKGLPLRKYLDSVTPAHLVIIATPDDAIAEVAADLARVFSQVSPQEKQQKRVALHTSGALSSEVLRPLRKSGFATGSMHPLVSVSEAQAGASWLTRAYFSVEGDEPAIRSAKQIVRDLGAQSFSIDAAEKALYHAAALMASPNLTALLDIALEMLSRCGVSSTQARKVLLPLVQSTFENLANQTPKAALTGTFKRRDLATVRKHVAAIKSQDLSDALTAYAILGMHSLSLSGSGADPKAVAIQKVLNKLLKKSR